MLPSLDIAGVTIYEPTTTVTDYLITVFAIVFGGRLLKGAFDGRYHSRWFWSLGFLFIGLGAFLGGTSHGFVEYLGDEGLRLIWKGTVYCVGFSMIFAVAGTIEGSVGNVKVRNTLHGANALAFAIYAAWMVSHSAFIYVIYYYVPAMTSVALIQVWAYWRDRQPSAPWIIAGVIVTLLGAIIQQSGFTLHRHFNHNDLYHIVQIVGLWLLYRGVTRFTPASE
jgi:hypothetical protein